MLSVKIKFVKGILFIRVEGSLVKRNVNTFEREVIPLLLNYGIKKIVFNFDKVNVIDVKGVDSLIKINEIVRDNKGKIVYCSLTSYQVRKTIHALNINNRFYETSNELTALRMMKI